MCFFDKITLPSTGIAGYSAWGGDAPVYQASASSPVTLPSYIHDKWKTTIRTKNHMNGEDVINTLSDTWGAWKQGLEKTHIKFPNGPFQNDKPELLEQQHYVSSDKSKFTGYVRNRAYNARTRGCSDLTFPSLDFENHFHLPYSIPWDSQPILNRLKVYNLQQGEDYSIHLKLGVTLKQIVKKLRMEIYD